MFSNMSTNAVVLFLVFLVSACGLRTGEKNVEPTTAKVKSAQCLTQAISDFKIYFKGDASEYQVESSVSCLEEVFVAFKDNIRGEKKNVYTPREIATFVEMNFFTEDDSKFSDDFLTQLMFFKVALFGGDENVITKGEVDLIVRLIAKFKPDLVALNPHMRILTLNWANAFSNLDESTQEIHFIAAKNQFQKVLSKLTSEFAVGGRVYKVDHLAQFAVEVLKFTKATEKNIDLIQRAGPVLTQSKKVLIGGDVSLQGVEWDQLGNIVHEAYFQYLRYEYFLKNLDDKQTEKKWNAYDKIANDVISLLEEILQFKKVIMTPELAQLVLVAQKQEILETTITEKALTMTFDALWSNILNRPEDRLSGVSRPGFDLVALQQIAPEIKTWLGTQKHVAQIFSDLSLWKKEMISAEFVSHMESEADEGVKKSLSDMTAILSEPIPLTFNKADMLKILDPASMDYHQADLTWSNLARLLSRILIRSYATDLQRANEFVSVTQEEAQKAYDQLKPIAVDLDAVDQSNDTFVKSRFLESNLFLSVSNGDKFASFVELHHLVVHIISGLYRSEEIKDEMLKTKDFSQNCILVEANGDKTIKGTTRVYEKCILDQYINSATGFQSMPVFTDMRTKFTETELRDHYLALLKAAGHVSREDKTVLMADANLFPHVIQYIEMVYARHDVNRDNLIQKEEALSAFPIFKDLLMEVVKSYKQIKEEDLEGVFIYILKFGRPPRPQSIGEVLKFVAFIKDKTQKDWVINSTRVDLGRIFNFIADTAVRPPAPTPAPPATPTEPKPVDPVPVTPTPTPVPGVGKVA